MKIVDPGVGELCDRLSILALKVLFSAKAGKDVKHFSREQTAILAKIRTRDLNGVWFQNYTELAAVNAALWHVEDDLRDIRAVIQAVKDGGEMTPLFLQAAPLAMRIQELNDLRATLIAAINKDAGDDTGAEKLHGA